MPENPEKPKTVTVSGNGTLSGGGDSYDPVVAGTWSNGPADAGVIHAISITTPPGRHVDDGFNETLGPVWSLLRRFGLALGGDGRFG